MSIFNPADWSIRPCIAAENIAFNITFGIPAGREVTQEQVRPRRSSFALQSRGTLPALFPTRFCIFVLPWWGRQHCSSCILQAEAVVIAAPNARCATGGQV